jgi:NAD(P)-dependent dehydrogenase (short-subunit alcohol dehydrogenase family)
LSALRARRKIAGARNSSGLQVLHGKRIAVTGAFGSLGVVTLRAVVAAGGNAAGIAHGPVSKAPVQLGDVALFGDTDISDASAAEATLRAVAQKLGGLDGLVNIAGAFRWGKVAESGPDLWSQMHRTNLLTAVNATRAALPLLNSNGRIISIGANGALKAGAGMAPYAASKAGVAKLTEALAAEVKDRNITVNAILPSIIDTPANRADMPNADFSHWVQPAQIADLIVFLLSDRASAITGALIPIVGRV